MTADSKLVEVMARAICRANCGPRMQRDEPDRVECQVENGWDLWADEANAALTALEAAGWRVVPVEPTAEMLKAGHLAMPVEYKYWQQGGMLHAELLPHHECVSPASPWQAMLAAAPKP